MGVCCQRDSRNRTSLVPGNLLDQSEIVLESKLSSILRHYKFIKVKGHGQFGTVREAVRITDQNGPMKGLNLRGRHYAIKSILKSRVRGKCGILRKEVNTLKLCDHPNIVRLYEVYEDQQYLHLVMELCEGKDLMEYLYENGSLSEQVTVQLMRKLLSAINHIHNMNICHRDMKPDNILFHTNDSNSEIKIVDFGMAAKFGEHGLNSSVGTPYYIAPEVIIGNYGKSCDIWSLGVTMYFLLSGCHPFQGDTLKELVKNICKGRFSFEQSPDMRFDWSGISSEAKDLIRNMLQVQPKQRITVTQALKHPWFKLQVQTEQIQFTHTMLANLQKPKAKGKFQKEILKVMVKYLNEDDIRQLKNLFSYLDKDNTGLVNIKDIRDTLMSSGLQPAQVNLESIMEQFFSHNEEKLKYSEFLTIVLDAKQLLIDENLWVTFKQLDTDDDDFITLQDFQNMLEQSGCDISRDQLIMLGKEFALDIGDLIDYSQFKQLMQCFSSENSPAASQIFPDSPLRIDDSSNGKASRLRVSVSRLPSNLNSPTLARKSRLSHITISNESFNHLLQQSPQLNHQESVPNHTQEQAEVQDLIEKYRRKSSLYLQVQDIDPMAASIDSILGENGDINTQLDTIVENSFAVSSDIQRNQYI